MGRLVALAMVVLTGCASKNPCITLGQYRGSECSVSMLKCSQDVSDGYFDCACPDGTKWSWKVDPSSWSKRAGR